MILVIYKNGRGQTFQIPFNNLNHAKKKETNEFDKQASNFPDPFTKEHEEPALDDIPF